MNIKHLLLIAGIAYLPNILCAAEGICARTSSIRRKPPIKRLLKPCTDLNNWTNDNLLQKAVICHLGADGYSILAFHELFTTVAKTGYPRTQDHFGFALIPQSSTRAQGLYVDRVGFLNRKDDALFFTLGPDQEVETNTLATTIAAYLSNRRFLALCSTKDITERLNNKLSRECSTHEVALYIQRHLPDTTYVVFDMQQYTEYKVDTQKIIPIGNKALSDDPDDPDNLFEQTAYIRGRRTSF